MIRRLGAAIVLACSPALAAAAPAPIVGRWLTAEGKAIVEIEPCGSALCGRITRILKPRPGGPAVDANNPDKTLRTRPIQGLAILTGFAPSGGRWKGRIYDPESGNTYRSELIRSGSTLKVKGCWTLICRTQQWSLAR
ncbi:DUF2147 domain-containing protein [Sphingomonas aerophila]|jgi:uncharacterized protein (DUF2147 family)|uniref:Uncharacterized protein (DUF2147 family) n=1 Tax=Sphingomonas aerophila TaxID=1344948 RepID=A0A7W9BFN4_9SPHN|nr:DUF2147 domain-containing protein [Sphingomonas aerophila]MBB5716006.1 uncharacterized protein (DUF2147 family) [Sphingomonas aerophila]